MRTPVHKLTLALAFAFFLPAGMARAHSGWYPAADEKQPAPAFKVQKVGERVYALFGRGGNVGFLVTDKGVAVVDDQFREMAPGIVEEIKKITDKPIRYLINTHFHGDHTGGNPVFQSIAEIVAHDAVRPRLLEYPMTVQKTFPARVQSLQAEIEAIKDPADPYRDALTENVGIMKFMIDTFKDFSPETAAPPVITYDSRATLWLGDEPVILIHVAPGHTDGDTMVWFPKQKVLHTGDLMFNGMMPLIDVDGGGSGLGYIRNLDWVLENIPAETQVIPGHGPVTDMAGLRHFRDFLKDVDVAVEKAVKKGMSRIEAARTIKLEAYPDMKQNSINLANEVLVFYDEIHVRK